MCSKDIYYYYNHSTLIWVVQGLYDNYSSLTVHTLLRQATILNIKPAEFLPDFAFAHYLLRLDFKHKDIYLQHHSLYSSGRQTLSQSLMKQALQKHKKKIRKLKAWHVRFHFNITVWIHRRIEMSRRTSRSTGKFERNPHSHPTNQTPVLRIMNHSQCLLQ